MLPVPSLCGCPFTECVGGILCVVCGVLLVLAVFLGWLRWLLLVVGVVQCWLWLFDESVCVCVVLCPFSGGCWLLFLLWLWLLVWLALAGW